MMRRLIAILPSQIIWLHIAHYFVVPPVNQILKLPVLVLNGEHIITRTELTNRQLGLTSQELTTNIDAVDIILRVILALEEITLVEVPDPLLSLRRSSCKTCPLLPQRPHVHPILPRVRIKVNFSDDFLDIGVVLKQLEEVTNEAAIRDKRSGARLSVEVSSSLEATE